MVKRNSQNTTHPHQKQATGHNYTIADLVSMVTVDLVSMVTVDLVLGGPMIKRNYLVKIPPTHTRNNLQGIIILLQIWYLWLL